MDKTIRNRIEKRILDTFSILDKTGDNTAKYKQILKNMSDKELEDFLNNDDENFYLEIEAYKREPKMSDIEETADFLGVPLYEYVALPFLEGEDPEDGISTTPVPVAVGYLHMKRVQQMLNKKNSMSIHVNKRQGKTGQVIGSDKNSRVSDVENINLIVAGLTETMKEFNGPRADNLKAKAEMANAISTNGFVSQKDYSNNKKDKVALNTLDVFFTAAMIKTDLITDGLLLPRTLEQKKDNGSISMKYRKDL